MKVRLIIEREGLGQYELITDVKQDDNWDFKYALQMLIEKAWRDLTKVPGKLPCPECLEWVEFSDKTVAEEHIKTHNEIQTTQG